MLEGEAMNRACFFSRPSHFCCWWLHGQLRTHAGWSVRVWPGRRDPPGGPELVRFQMVRGIIPQHGVWAAAQCGKVWSNCKLSGMHFLSLFHAKCLLISCIYQVMDPLFHWMEDTHDMEANVALGWVLAIAGTSLIVALVAAVVSTRGKSTMHFY